MSISNQAQNKEWIIQKCQKQQGSYNAETKAEASLEKAHGKLRRTEARGLEAENRTDNSTNWASACGSW